MRGFLRVFISCVSISFSTRPYHHANFLISPSGVLYGRHRNIRSQTFLEAIISKEPLPHQASSRTTRERFLQLRIRFRCWLLRFDERQDELNDLARYGSRKIHPGAPARSRLSEADIFEDAVPR